MYHKKVFSTLPLIVDDLKALRSTAYFLQLLEMFQKVVMRYTDEI